MTVYANIKRPVFKGFNTILSLLTEESERSHFSLCSVIGTRIKSPAMRVRDEEAVAVREK